MPIELMPNHPSPPLYIDNHDRDESYQDSYNYYRSIFPKERFFGGERKGRGRGRGRERGERRREGRIGRFFLFLFTDNFIIYIYIYIYIYYIFLFMIRLINSRRYPTMEILEPRGGGSGGEKFKNTVKEVIGEAKKAGVGGGRGGRGGKKGKKRGGFGEN